MIVSDKYDINLNSKYVDKINSTSTYLLFS